MLATTAFTPSFTIAGILLQTAGERALTFPLSLSLPTGCRA
jgi:hypothetical protein